MTTCYKGCHVSDTLDETLPWRTIFCHGSAHFHDKKWLLSCNISMTSHTWLYWFCHKTITDVHGWQNTWPATKNGYHHGCVFFSVVSHASSSSYLDLDVHPSFIIHKTILILVSILSWLHPILHSQWPWVDTLSHPSFAVWTTQRRSKVMVFIIFIYNVSWGHLN